MTRGSLGDKEVITGTGDCTMKWMNVLFLFFYYLWWDRDEQREEGLEAEIFKYFIPIEISRELVSVL